MCSKQIIESKPNESMVLSKALGKLKEYWELSGVDLAEIVGVAPSVISCLDTAQVFCPNKKQGQLALLLIRVYRSLGAFLGDRMQLQKDWLNAPNQVFNQSPLESMKTPEGLAHVVMYLDAMRGAEG